MKHYSNSMERGAVSPAAPVEDALGVGGGWDRWGKKRNARWRWKEMMSSNKLLEWSLPVDRGASVRDCGAKPGASSFFVVRVAAWLLVACWLGTTFRAQEANGQAQDGKPQQASEPLAASQQVMADRFSKLEDLLLRSAEFPVVETV